MTAKQSTTRDPATIERESRLQALIRERLHIEVPDPETELLESGLIDSLAFVELLLIVENEFGISAEFDDLDMGNFQTLQRIVAFIEARLTDSPGTIR